MEQLNDFDLDEDVLLKILTHCDAYTVLTISRVNKFFYRIAHTKSLWLSLCADLVAAYLMDENDDLENFSTVELIRTVKRLVCGPETWSNRSRAPQISRSTSIDIDIRRRAVVQLLPGGRYIVVHHLGTRIECWCLDRRKCVWMRPRTLSCRILFFRVQMVEGGQAAIFLWFSHGVGRQIVQIVRVSLVTGFSEDLFSMSFPVHANTCSSPAFVGDFFSISFRHHGLFILLVNWREAKCILFDGKTSKTARASALSANHFFLAAVTFHNQTSIPQLRVYSLESLTASEWQETSSLWVSDLKTTKVQPVEVQSITSWRGGPPRVYLNIHESPLRMGTLKITLNITGCTPPPVVEESLFTRLRRAFRPPALQLVHASMLAVLFVDASPSLRVELRKCHTFSPPVLQENHYLSYGGYHFDYYTGMVTDVDPHRQESEFRKAPQVPWKASVSRCCKDLVSL
ncbi:hypothetical protein B0H19DRAFT_1380365 [Mycena capillaripes]|nr:hypothetical protein B0H19DRAFT_1380365 [Mycena capillaripes]